jgi:hypothetical protein
VLFFFISTKFLPVVASILPIWILARNFNLLNTRLVLIILYIGINLPLASWMLRLVLPGDPARADRGRRDRRREPARAADLDHPADGRRRASPRPRCCA